MATTTTTTTTATTSTATATVTATLAATEPRAALLAVERRGGGGHAIAGLRRSARLAPRVLDAGPSAVHACILPTQAGPLAGDHDRLRIVVGAGATLVVQPIAATLALPGPARTRLELDVEVGREGRLVLDDAPLIVAAGADVARVTTVTLHAGAVATLRDIVVLGRAGEPGGGRLDGTLRVVDEQGLVLHDAIRLDPQAADAHVALAPGHRVAATIVLLGRAADDPRYALARGGALRRASARELADADAALAEPWARWAAAVTA